MLNTESRKQDRVVVLLEKSIPYIMNIIINCNYKNICVDNKLFFEILAIL